MLFEGAVRRSWRDARSRAGTLLLLALLVLGGCSSQEQPSDSSPQEGEPVAGGTLHRRLAGNPARLDPFFGGSTRDEREVLPLLYDELLGTSREMQLDFSCALAESAEAADDGRSVVIRLKPGLLWQDGAPLTVDDLVYTFELLRSESVPERLRQRHDSVEVETVEPLGERSIRLRFTRPLAYWKNAANLPVFPRHLIEPEVEAAEAAGGGWDPDASTLVSEPVGTGPYRLVERREGVGLILERWEEYPGTQPFVDQVVYHVIQESEAALNAYLAGEIDEMLVQPEQLGVESIRASLEERGRLVAGGTWSTDLVIWNMRDDLFANVRVRFGMARLINAAEIVDTLLAGDAELASCWFPPGYEGHDPDIPADYHDVATAHDMFEEAGWIRSRDTGEWQRDGEAVRFELIHGASDFAATVATALQADLADMGVRADLRPVEFATLESRLRDRDFQAALVRFHLPRTPDLTARTWHSSEADSGRNYCGLEDDSIDEWFDEAGGMLDPEQRGALYRKIDARLTTLRPVLFLWHPHQTYAVADRVRGYRTSIRGPHAFHPGQRAWWLADAGPQAQP